MSDLTEYNAWDGMALGMSIGGLEMLAYVFVISATANIGIINYNSIRDSKGKRIKTLREIRLTFSELIFLFLGIIMIIGAAYRETVMAFS
jgi:hypothetical protein